MDHVRRMNKLEAAEVDRCRNTHQAQSDIVVKIVGPLDASYVYGIVSAGRVNSHLVLLLQEKKPNGYDTEL